METTNDPPTTRIGKCLHCGAIEVTLNRVTEVRDMSAIGESSAYPHGYGCEVCS